MISPYNRSVTFLFVDTDAELNAGQVIEPDNEIQAGCCCCATARGAEAIRETINILILNILFLVGVKPSVEEWEGISLMCCERRPQFVNKGLPDVSLASMILVRYSHRDRNQSFLKFSVYSERLLYCIRTTVVRVQGELDVLDANCYRKNNKRV